MAGAGESRVLFQVSLVGNLWTLDDVDEEMTMMMDEDGLSLSPEGWMIRLQGPNNSFKKSKKAPNTKLRTTTTATV